MPSRLNALNCQKWCARPANGLEDAQRAHAALPGLEAALAKASDAAAAAHEFVSLRAQAEKIRVQVLDARDAHQSARGRWLDLVQKRIEGMAAELAEFTRAR